MGPTNCKGEEAYIQNWVIFFIWIIKYTKQ